MYFLGDTEEGLSVAADVGLEGDFETGLAAEGLPIEDDLSIWAGFVSDSRFELIVAVAIVDIPVHGCCVFGDLEQAFGVVEGIEVFEAEGDVEGREVEEVDVSGVDFKLNVAVAAFDASFGGGVFD